MHLHVSSDATDRYIRVDIELPGYESLITRERNTLVAKLLGHPNITHLMFIDVDIAKTADGRADVYESCTAANTVVSFSNMRI